MCKIKYAYSASLAAKKKMLFYILFHAIAFLYHLSLFLDWEREPVGRGDWNPPAPQKIKKV